MPNPPEKSKVSAVEIGDKLRRAREDRGLTIEQAQKQTRIHSTVLAAIEDGRCDDILTPNYVKSFLKEYSSYLGCDHRAIVSEYLVIHPELKTRGMNFNVNNTEQRSSEDLAKIIRVVRSVVFFLLIVSLAVFVSVKTTAFFKNMKAVKKPQGSRYAKSAYRAGSHNSNGQASQRKAASAKNVPFTLTLKTRNPVMVQLKKDGVLIFKRVLPKGTEETLSADSAVNMFVGRAEAIEIIVNGKSLGSPGRGVIRNLEVTSNGMRVR